MTKKLRRMIRLPELFDARSGAKLRSAIRAVIATLSLALSFWRPSLRSALAVLGPSVSLMIEALVQLFIVDTDASFTTQEAP